LSWWGVLCAKNFQHVLYHKVSIFVVAGFCHAVLGSVEKNIWSGIQPPADLRDYQEEYGTKKRHIPLIVFRLLMTAPTIVVPFGGNKLGIHPAWVKEFVISINIFGKKLSQSGDKFHYTLEESFMDCFEDCGRTRLE